MTAHLELMSKPRLIQIIGATEKRARQHAELADYWRSLLNGVLDTAPKPAFAPSPETTLLEAARILRGLRPDPDAAKHRADLDAELDSWSQQVGPPRPRARKPGPRCTRGRCDKPLNKYGLCPRCETTQTRSARLAEETNA